ncbi:olfactory receptor 1G1-like [Ambystoma mexicanum]|uniref:olfactory receptor 1G1-like n=1 Tax=Ambystoma mexicanum TaxID=8296 RepID=UPI0037E8CF77
MTSGGDFILLGFTDLPDIRAPLLAGFLIIYLVTIGGNILVMSVIYCDSHLQTPMYFFLTNLSFIDISSISVTFPKMLASFYLQSTHITLRVCLVQLYFFFFLFATEIFLLTLMAYDRYVAICYPLHYTMIMNKSVTFRLAAGAWLFGLTEPLFHTISITTFSFCKTHEINHFFCDFTALMKLSCTSTQTTEIMTFITGVIVGIFSWVLIITSYVKIILALLRIQSVMGRHKAFSTCTSHLTIVILFYGSIMFVYMRPASSYSDMQSKISSLVYVALIPMCNPIIYTLKNKEFKDALKRKILCLKSRSE